MIQQKLKLSTEFNLILKNCDEIWIAVAMVSDSGFRYIQDNISKSAKQNYLVGIGLPTSPNVLRKLMNYEGNGLFESRIHHQPNKLFHPKVFIIKSNGLLTSYVGSGNCTEGGFEKNIEVGVKTDDIDFCNNLLKWFNSLFIRSTDITETFLQSYQLLFNNRMERKKKDQQEINSIFPDDNSNIDLENINFTNQFFKKCHFQAFEGKKPWDESDVVNAERKEVRTQLFKLNDILLPRIKAKNWNLSEHYVFEDTVSSYKHGQYTSNELSGIWLHYGRNKREIKAYGEDQTPLDFMRLQVIILKDKIGIWNRIGKDNGSRIDRDNLKNKLKNDQKFRQKLFSIVQNLPEDFYIEVNYEQKYVRDFVTEQQLTEYLLKDDFKYYLIIGVDFTPDDIRLSKQNISDTIIENFELLYPTYTIIKHFLRL